MSYGFRERANQYTDHAGELAGDAVLTGLDQIAGHIIK